MSAKKERNIETNKLTWCVRGKIIIGKKKKQKALKEMCLTRTVDSKTQFITKNTKKIPKIKFLISIFNTHLNYTTIQNSKKLKYRWGWNRRFFHNLLFKGYQGYLDTKNKEKDKNKLCVNLKCQRSKKCPQKKDWSKLRQSI